jgi:glycosyltransferase involved in cell wall biosynthesis
MFTLLTAVNAPIHNEVQTLVESGRQVVLLALAEGYEPASQMWAEGVEVRWIHLKSRGLPQNSIAWALKYLEALVRMILQGVRVGADLYEAHDIDALLPAFIVARLQRKKLLLNAHELWTERPVVPARPLWRWLERALIPRADAVICPEDARAGILFEEYGARARPAVIANCDLFRPVDRTTRLPDFLAKCGVANARIVLYQGGLSPNRCCEELIEAFCHVSTDSVLVLMGLGAESYVEHLRSVIARLSLERKVFLHPAVHFEEIMTYTASADIGVALYRNNGRNNYHCAPTKLSEYLMAGLPVIVSDFPGMQTLVGENHVGLLVDPESPLEIAQAVDRLTVGRELYERLSQQALWFVESRYNWQQESPKLLAVYDDLLKATK